MEIYMNRELSWLKFNERVLEEAESREVPLCERLNFLSIYQSNLDEFFMVRVGTLLDQLSLEQEVRDNKTQMTSAQQIKAIGKAVSALNRRKDAVYGELLEILEGYGIHMVNIHNLSAQEERCLKKYFENEIAPLISPLIVGKRQPFPFLQNREIYAVGVLAGKNGQEKLGVIPCGTGVIPRLIEIPGYPGEYFLSEELILHFLEEMFKGYRVVSKALIRVTRSADIDADTMYDEDVDYREFMADVIRKRRRLMPVRMEITGNADDGIVRTLCEFTDIRQEGVYRSRSALDLSYLFRIQDILRQRTDLFYEKRFPQKSASVKSGVSMMKQIRNKDILLSYPYESMKPFLDFLQEAATDPHVASIRMTLYRVARHSKVVEALIEAAENGKNVLVLVELKARFDEENNIEWSRRLEEAGCQVIYGLDGYKVHSKLCLVTRVEHGKTEYFTQIGTGNYNEKTARLYTDLCLMTASPDIGREASLVFQALAKGETVEKTDILLTAPKCFQNRILDMIDQQIEYAKAGKPAYIGVKINALTDKTIIDRLIEASQAGVQIDMIVRGICCLIPGVKGYTENIRVVSVVGRYLEHSRIYMFGMGTEREVYIGSADFMTRNTLRRVEVAVPLRDRELKNRVIRMFEIMLQDNRQARTLQNTGEYVRVRSNGTQISSQEYFCREAYDAAQGVNERKDHGRYASGNEKGKQGFITDLKNFFSGGNRK